MISRDKLTAVLKKMVAFGSKPNEQTFPELPEVLIWVRFSLALAFGLYLGNNPTSKAGGVMLVQALNLIGFVPVLYCRFYLAVEGEAFAMAMIFSGLFNALALCMLLWLYFYTAEHEPEIAKMTALLVAKAVQNQTVGDDATDALDGTAAGGAAAENQAAAGEEPEF